MEGIGLFVGDLYNVPGCSSDRNMVELKQYCVTIENIFAAQPAADVLTVLVCLFSIKPMQDIASRNLHH